jgi:uncharacterized protein (TIGR01370 family)
MIERQSACDRTVLIASSRTRRAFLAATASLLAAATANAVPAETDHPPAIQSPIRWLAFYGPTADEATLAAYDIVVLDPAFQGSIRTIAVTGTRVCGYISLGEIRDSDPFRMYLAPEALLTENPDWPGTHRVDIRHPSWRTVVLDHQIPHIVSLGFTGLMFDTLDTPPYLEELDPVRYHGMRAAAIDLVRAIRTHWPNLMLIINRGYALLPDVVQHVDAIIAESFMTSPDHQSGGFVWHDRQLLDLQLTLLTPAAVRRPALPILSLDYWDPSDSKTIAEIYRRERDLGHHPYVATRSLDRIVPEER